MTSKLNAKTILAWVLTLGLPLAIYFIPITETFTLSMRTFLVITSMAILMIAFENVPTSAVTLLLPVAYMAFGLADGSLAWLAWTMPTLWMVIGSLLLVNVLDSSGFLNRVSFKILQLVGGSYQSIILAIGIIGIVANLVLFGSGCVILAGIAFGLCRALKLEKFSKEATGIFLAAAVSGIVPSIFLYGVNIIMVEGYWAGVVGNSHISYLDFTFFNLPVVVYYFLALVIILFLFKSNNNISSKAYATESLQEMGTMSATEKKAAVWTIIMIAYVIGCGIIGKDCTLAFVVIPGLMLLPGVGCGTEEDVKKLDFSFILFVASCMSIGFVAGNLGFGALISELTAPLTQNTSPEILTMGMYFINVLMNFLLTPMAVMAGFTSTFAQIALDAGINPYVVYVIESLGLDQILFPYEYALYLMYFSFGFVTMKDFVKYFGAK